MSGKLTDHEPQCEIKKMTVTATLAVSDGLAVATQLALPLGNRNRDHVGSFIVHFWAYLYFNMSTHIY